MVTPIDHLNADQETTERIKALHIQSVEELLALYTAYKDHSASLILTDSLMYDRDSIKEILKNTSLNERWLIHGSRNCL